MIYNLLITHLNICQILDFENVPHSHTHASTQSQRCLWLFSSELVLKFMICWWFWAVLSFVSGPKLPSTIRTELTTVCEDDVRTSLVNANSLIHFTNDKSKQQRRRHEVASSLAESFVIREFFLSFLNMTLFIGMNSSLMKHFDPILNFKLIVLFKANWRRSNYK